MPATAHPYLDVSFGDISARAVWDGGAGVTVVDEAFRPAHPQLFQPGEPSFGADASGAKVATPTWTIAESVIGGLSFVRHKAATVDLSGVNAAIERPMDLILGYPALCQADWLFDFPARRWAVSR